MTARAYDYMARASAATTATLQLNTARPTEQDYLRACRLADYTRACAELAVTAAAQPTAQHADDAIADLSWDLADRTLITAWAIRYTRVQYAATH